MARREPHHVQFASGQAVGGDPIRVQRVEIVARADDDGLRLDDPATGLEFAGARRRERPSRARRRRRSARPGRPPVGGSPRATRRESRAGCKARPRTIPNAGPSRNSRCLRPRRGGTRRPCRWRETARAPRAPPAVWRSRAARVGQRESPPPPRPPPRRRAIVARAASTRPPAAL